MIKQINDSSLLRSINADLIWELLGNHGLHYFVLSLDLHQLSERMIVEELLLIAPDKIARDRLMLIRYEAAAEKVASKIFLSIEGACEEYQEHCSNCDLRDFCNHRRMMQM